MDDLMSIHAQFNDATRRRWFSFQEPDILTLEAAEKTIVDNMAICAGKINLLKSPFSLGIVLKQTGELIGQIHLSKFHGPDNELEDVEVGWNILAAHQNKGYATEAAKAAIEWGLNELDAFGARPRIISEIEHDNWPSRKVAKKAGMTLAYAKEYVSVYEIYGQTSSSDTQM
jgi:RimJ/RimL family protein N-acetyltransferase